MATNDPATDGASAAPSQTAPGGVVLVDGERFLGELQALDGHRFVLTSARVVYASSRSGDDAWAVAFLPDISAVRVLTQRKERRSLIWGIVGVLAAIGVWQVATNDTVSIVGGIVVGAIALILLGEYFFRPPDLRLELFAGSGSIAWPFSRRKAESAREFARLIQEARVAAQVAAASPAPPPRRLPRYPAA